MLPKSLKVVSKGNSCDLYDRFVAELIRLHQQQINLDLSELLVRYLNMSNQSQFQQIDKLKGWLDSFRPLAPIIVAELKKLYDVKFTYNSNAIEGNTHFIPLNMLLLLIIVLFRYIHLEMAMEEQLGY